VTARGVCLGAAACALVAAASLASAAETPPTEHPVPETPGAHPTIDEVRAEEARRETRAYVVGRISWSYPQKAGGALGAIVSRIPSDYDCTTTCLLRGLMVQGSAGLGGGELALGYGSLVGETGASRRFLRHPYVGWGARAAFVRTWGLSELEPQGASFVGAEAAVTIAQFNLVVGLFHELGSEPSGRGVRVFGGAGWGF